MKKKKTYKKRVLYQGMFDPPPKMDPDKDFTKAFDRAIETVHGGCSCNDKDVDGKLAVIPLKKEDQ